jgi:hypothetical protein
LRTPTEISCWHLPPGQSCAGCSSDGATPEPRSYGLKLATPPPRPCSFVQGRATRRGCVSLRALTAGLTATAVLASARRAHRFPACACVPAGARAGTTPTELELRSWPRR